MSAQVTRRSLVLGSSAVVATALARTRPLSAAEAAAPVAPAQSGGGLARLIANENPYGPAASARRAVADSLATAWQYPMGHDQDLKKQIAEREGLTPSHIMLADGSSEILRIAGLVYGTGGREVVAARPTFGFLQDYARQLGATVTEVPLDEQLRHDLKGLAAAVTGKTGLLYVCNPNNPTGTLIPGPELRPFLQAMASRTTVLVDEAYLDLWDDWPAHTATDRVRAGDPVIVTRTFSKLHGMAGLRVGYALAPPEIIQRLEKHRMTLLGCAGVAAATASYQDLEFQAFSRARLQEGLAITTGALRELKLRHVEQGRGNFVFFDTGGPLADFSAAMRRAGYQVGRPFPPYDTWCRVSMGTVEQMRGFAAALRDYF
ncbi:MAG: histidinol-phosphate aminotransferase family protein [Chromatiales bacterium]|nr:histidinol-phosphate aminotransferase family protein [Chromatiales bacterium]